MDFVIVLLIAAMVFGVCFLLDKAFTRTFRNKQQHKSGKAVRINKRFGSIGLIIAVLGLGGMISALGSNWLLFAGGCFLMIVGSALVVYYMTFGVYYDDDGFVLTTFGKKSETYQYGEIKSQQLFTSYNQLVIELYMADGRSVQLMAAMEGVYPFLDKASAAWMESQGKTAEECDFYDPDNSCWFPAKEE